jgi:hypothetical protein
MSDISGTGPRSAKPRCTPAHHLVAALAGILASWLSFGEFFTSRFDRVAGNFGDARLIIALQEHWYNVYRGREAWQSPPFFFPVKHVLSYSATVWLQSLPYSLLRLAGCDPYVAFELTLLLFAWVGYAFTIILLRRLGVNRGFAILGAILFIFSNLFHIWILAPQSYTMMLVPALLVCVASAVEHGAAHRGRAMLLLSLAGVLYSAILFSDFYTGWCVAFFALIAGVMALLIHGKRVRSGIAVVKRHWLLALCPLAAAALALVPFVMTYGPAIAANQGRPFDQVLRYSVSFPDLVNVHGGNLVWGRRLCGIADNYAHLEWAYGLPPGLLAGFAAVVGLMLLRRRVFAWERSDLRFVLVSSAATAVLVAWALLFKANGDLGWYYVWRWVPGGSAIRVTPRFQYQLSLIVVLVVVSALSFAWDTASSHIGSGTGPRAKVTLALIGTVSAFLLIEQVNLVQTHGVSRQQEQARLGLVPSPPFYCESFGLQEAVSARPSHPISLAVDAMLIAERLAVPTVNGYSGFNPPGWRLSNPAGPDFLAVLGLWASQHHLRHLCVLEISRKRWIEDPLGHPGAPPPAGGGG